MGIAYNSKIVTDGLVFCYDEGNVKSSHTSELILNRTAIVDNSIRQFAQDSLLATTYSTLAQYNSLAPFPGTGFSMLAWIRRTGSTTGTWDPLVVIDNGGSRYRMMWFGFFTNITDKIHCSMPYYSAIDTTSYWDVNPTWADAGLVLTTNQWYNFAVTYDNSLRLTNTYINGIFALSGTRPGAGDLNNPNNAYLRIYGCNNTSYGNSQVTSVSIYNRALSAAEIVQNFAATRGRFGL